MSYGQNVAENFKTDEFNIAIFPQEHSEFLPEKRFTPTKEDILQAEKALKTNLKFINKNLANQSSSPIIHKNLKKYKRQYFGCYDEQGRKYLLINSFWSDRIEEKGWLNGMVIVMDGGSYYWQIKYYLENDELKDLSVNGYA